MYESIRAPNTSEEKQGCTFFACFLFIGIPGFRQRDKNCLVFLKQGSLFCEPIDKNNTTYELTLSPQIFVPNEEYCFFDVWSAVFRECPV